MEGKSKLLPERLFLWILLMSPCSNCMGLFCSIKLLLILLLIVVVVGVVSPLLLLLLLLIVIIVGYYY